MTSTVIRVSHTTSQRVFDVIADGWQYGSWVVGTARVRAVDPDFPAVGTDIHHSVGSWPVLVDDRSRVLSVRPGQEIVLDVALGPFGRGTVTVRLRSLGPDRCEVALSEEIDGRLARVLPERVKDAVLTWRNTESVRRLIMLAEASANPESGS